MQSAIIPLSSSLRQEDAQFWQMEAQVKQASMHNLYRWYPVISMFCNWFQNSSHESDLIVYQKSLIILLS